MRPARRINEVRIYTPGGSTTSTATVVLNVTDVLTTDADFSTPDGTDNVGAAVTITTEIELRLAA